MRYIGLDLGTRTLGISVSDKTLRFGEENYESLIPELQTIIEEKEITDFVLGLPKNMNNSLGYAAQRSMDFAELLKKHFGLPVHFVDERLSTVEAEKILISTDKSRKKRKKVIDNIASSLILETYLKKKEREL